MMALDGRRIEGRAAGGAGSGRAAAALGAASVRIEAPPNEGLPPRRAWYPGGRKCSTG